MSRYTKTNPKFIDMEPIDAIAKQLASAVKTLAKMKAAPDIMGGQWKVKMIAHWTRRVDELTRALDDASNEVTKHET